jgi:hypothetical protein
MDLKSSAFRLRCLRPSGRAANRALPDSRAGRAEFSKRSGLFGDLRVRIGIKMGLAGLLALFCTQVLRLPHYAFILTGTPGILLTVAFMFSREPKRQDAHTLPSWPFGAPISGSSVREIRLEITTDRRGVPRPERFRECEEDPPRTSHGRRDSARRPIPLCRDQVFCHGPAQASRSSTVRSATRFSSDALS